MDKGKVSIIIPVYNGEKYLCKSVESALKQTYKNLEVIIVDDGSTDSSNEVINQLAIKDKRIATIKKENKGVSAARNTGIEMSTGKYLYFLDADDFLPSNAIEKLVCALDDNMHIAIGKIRFIDQSGNEEISSGNNRNIVYDLNKGYDFRRGAQHLSACAALYEKKYIGEIRFSENLYIGEDALFHNHAFVKCQRATFIPDVVYIYNMHEGSAFKSRFSEKKLTEIMAFKSICQLYKPYKRAYESARGELAIRCLNLMKQIAVSDNITNEIKKSILRLGRKNYKYVYRCGASVREIIICTIAFYFPDFFPFVYRNFR